MKIKRLILIVIFFLFTFVNSGICKELTKQSSSTDSRPNVILIMTDDQGFGDLGYNGNPHIKTPVLDKFASENIRFNKFYVSPVCAPTRSS